MVIAVILGVAKPVAIELVLEFMHYNLINRLIGSLDEAVERDRSATLTSVPINGKATRYELASDSIDAAPDSASG